MSIVPYYSETDVSNPFLKSPIVVDMTKHTGLLEPGVKINRVELRRVKEAVDINSSFDSRGLDSSFVIGLVAEQNLPKKDEPFRMAYHALSGNEGFGVGAIVDFGFIDTVAPIEQLTIIEDSFYFDTSEGSWRLKKLTLGN